MFALPTFFSFICRAPPPLKLPYFGSPFSRPRTASSSSPLRCCHSSSTPPASSFPLALFPPLAIRSLPRAGIPVSPGTLDDVATLLHVPRYYAYFTDFYGIPSRLVPSSSSLFVLSFYLSHSLSLSLIFFTLSLSLFLFPFFHFFSLSLSFSFSHSFYFRFKRRFSRSVAPRYHRLSSLLLVVTQRVLHSSRSRRSSPLGRPDFARRFPD